MEDTYTSPWAKLALFLEIYVPIFMFGKGWGTAEHNTVELFRAEFPAFIIDTIESFVIGRMRRKQLLP